MNADMISSAATMAMSWPGWNGVGVLLLAGTLWATIGLANRQHRLAELRDAATLATAKHFLDRLATLQLLYLSLSVSPAAIRELAASTLISDLRTQLARLNLIDFPTETATVAIITAETSLTALCGAIEKPASDDLDVIAQGSIYEDTKYWIAMLDREIAERRLAGPRRWLHLARRGSPPERPRSILGAAAAESVERFKAAHYDTKRVTPPSPPPGAA